MTLTRQNLDNLPRGTIVRATDLRGLPIAAVKIGDHQTTGGHTWSLTGPTTVESFPLAQRDAVLLTEAGDTATTPEAEALASVPVHARGGDDRPVRACEWAGHTVEEPGAAVVLLRPSRPFGHGQERAVQTCPVHLEHVIVRGGAAERATACAECGEVRPVELRTVLVLRERVATSGGAGPRRSARPRGRRLLQPGWRPSRRR
ncbi:hypothetical protein G8C93_00870 [Cellulosimicrobium cellulans]|uniref:hypothetical protein n=1 Tax=Cellulosimicrobium cellulans TaxID=1710 RepID=UPI001883CA2B|nr:hypothetical protein [Cellulosimicrobium cellulans]MBE9924444.1 hypothetical protein [Cellulosimicrobium cellulans]